MKIHLHKIQFYTNISHFQTAATPQNLSHSLSEEEEDTVRETGGLAPEALAPPEGTLEMVMVPRVFPRLRTLTGDLKWTRTLASRPEGPADEPPVGAGRQTVHGI